MVRTVTSGLILVLTACAAGGSSTETDYVNPPGCAAVVSPVPPERLDAPPRPLGMVIPPAPDGVDGDYEIRMVVGSDGRVDPSTIRLAGVAAERTPAWASSLAGWRFEPARMGGCFVPASFSYWVTFRAIG